MHNYRPRQFHRTLNTENPSSGCRDMGSTSLAAAHLPKRLDRDDNTPPAQRAEAHKPITMLLHITNNPFFVWVINLDKEPASFYASLQHNIRQFTRQKYMHDLFWKQTIYWPLPASVWLLHIVISLIGFLKGIWVLGKCWSITGCQELPSTNRGGMYKRSRYFDCKGE